MAEAWPNDVPFYAERGSWSEQPETYVADFQTEVGPPKRRLRSLVRNHLVSFKMLLSSAELEALEEFHDVTLQSGVLPFEATDPRLETACEYVFASPPTWVDAGFDLWQVTLSLRRRAQ